MTDDEKIIRRLLSVAARLKPEYIRKLMVCADMYYEIQIEKEGGIIDADA